MEYSGNGNWVVTATDLSSHMSSSVIAQADQRGTEAATQVWPGVLPASNN